MGPRANAHVPSGAGAMGQIGQEEEVRAIIKNAEDETERQFRNIKAASKGMGKTQGREKKRERERERESELTFRPLGTNLEITATSCLAGAGKLSSFGSSCQQSGQPRVLRMVAGEVRHVHTTAKHQMTSQHKINVLPLQHFG